MHQAPSSIRGRADIKLGFPWLLAIGIWSFDATEYKSNPRGAEERRLRLTLRSRGVATLGYAWRSDAQCPSGEGAYGRAGDAAQVWRDRPLFAYERGSRAGVCASVWRADRCVS